MPIYNGVGAWWMPDWMRLRLTSWFLRDFDEDAAEDHDLGYWLGRQSRVDVDTAFLLAMLEQATTRRQRVKARVIYLGVRLFGGASYSWREGKKPEC